MPPSAVTNSPTTRAMLMREGGGRSNRRHVARPVPPAGHAVACRRRRCGGNGSGALAGRCGGAGCRSCPVHATAPVASPRQCRRQRHRRVLVAAGHIHVQRWSDTRRRHRQPSHPGVPPQRHLQLCVRAAGQRHRRVLVAEGDYLRPGWGEHPCRRHRQPSHPGVPPQRHVQLCVRAAGQRHGRALVARGRGSGSSPLRHG